MEKLKSIRASISGRVAIAAALAALGLAAAGTAWAASGGDGQKGDSSAGERSLPAPDRGVGIGGPGFGPAPIAGAIGIGEGEIAEQFASELAEHLDGVSADEIETALGELADEHESERRTEMSEAIAAELDGVEAADVAAALEVAEQEVRSAFERGELPDPGAIAATLAAELDLSEDEVSAALGAAREKAFEAHGIEAGDVTMALPGGPGFGPPAIHHRFELPAPDAPPAGEGDSQG